MLKLNHYFIIILIFFNCLKIFARDCTGDMIYSKSSGIVATDCRCGLHQQFISDISSNQSKFGNCSQNYTNTVSYSSDNYAYAPDILLSQYKDNVYFYYDAMDPYANGTLPLIIPGQTTKITTIFDKSGKGNHLYIQAVDYSGYVVGANATYLFDSKIGSFVLNCNGAHLSTKSTVSINYSTGSGVLFLVTFIGQPGSGQENVIFGHYENAYQNMLITAYNNAPDVVQTAIRRTGIYVEGAGIITKVSDLSQEYTHVLTLNKVGTSINGNILLCGNNDVQNYIAGPYIAFGGNILNALIIVIPSNDGKDQSTTLNRNWSGGVTAPIN